MWSSKWIHSASFVIIPLSVMYWVRRKQQIWIVYILYVTGQSYFSKFRWGIVCTLESPVVSGSLGRRFNPHCTFPMPYMTSLYYWPCYEEHSRICRLLVVYDRYCYLHIQCSHFGSLYCILIVTFLYHICTLNSWPLKAWIKSHLLFAGIIRSSPFSPR